jgi:uncharacterized protein YggE
MANQTKQSDNHRSNERIQPMLNRPTKRFASLALSAALLVGVVGASAVQWGAAAPVAHAQGDATARTITVVGEGTVRIQPDVARANFGVEVVSNSVREALDENKTTMDAVLATLKEMGIEERDIQTTGFTIYADRYGPTGPLPPDQVNYRVSNNVTVVIRDLENLGDVVDAAVEAGANNIYGIQFQVDDPSPLESEARASAIADAQAKAQELAELTGVSVGPVVSVSEVIASGGYVASNFAQAARGDLGGGGATPISPGELELIMQLQVTYAIAE